MADATAPTSTPASGPSLETGGTDPGPAFDPAEVPTPEAPLPTIQPITVARVKKALKAGTKFAQETGAGALVRADVAMQDHEAEMIAPGIARYINSRPTLLAGVAAGGDEYLQMVVGSIFYGGRLFMERAAALQAEADAPPVAPSAPESPVTVTGITGLPA